VLPVDVSPTGDGRLRVSFRLFDVNTATQLEAFSPAAAPPARAPHCRSRRSDHIAFARDVSRGADLHVRRLASPHSETSIPLPAWQASLASRRMAAARRHRRP